MKPLILFIALFITVNCCFAQETLEITSKYDSEITEVYHVRKTDGKTMDGLYQMRFRKTIALASGLYKNGKKTGIWHFFGYDGHLLQNFNYDINTVTFEEPESPTTPVKYSVDKNIRDTDMVTKPLKPGGRVYGYLPLLRAFKKPKYFNEVDNSYLTAVIELLISPGGRLADYKISLQSGYYEPYNLNVNLDLLSDEDKMFAPATYNKEPISCTIQMVCYLDGRGHLVFDRPRPN